MRWWLFACLGCAHGATALVATKQPAGPVPTPVPTAPGQSVPAIPDVKSAFATGLPIAGPSPNIRPQFEMAAPPSAIQIPTTPTTPSVIPIPTTWSPNSYLPIDYILDGCTSYWSEGVQHFIGTKCVYDERSLPGGPDSIKR
jgi:hypothetical protein